LPRSRVTGPVGALAETAREVLQRLVTSQWRELRKTGDARSGKGRNVIDPEALVLYSAAISAESKSDLTQHLAWWTSQASWLLSVQRARSIAKTITRGDTALALVATYAYGLGGDRRWSRLVGEGANDLAGDDSDDPVHLRSSNSLMLRMRSAFGVSVKSDLVSYLMSLQGEAQSASDIAQQVAYSVKTVRLAANELELGGLVESRGDYPTHYSIAYGKAAKLLNVLFGEEHPARLPYWAAWTHVFAYLSEIANLRWSKEQVGNHGEVGAELEKFGSEFDQVFRWLHAPLPRRRGSSDTDYLSRLQDYVEQVEASLEDKR